ncbi:NAD-dependent succinate-semialdehyde dehydrogenase [Arachidicoccus terrestris]|uniref:NAD-dependent succinate-semialdehyde dehydrogenase n=1 Tax=Arachidicoccus terrestris TaxID=2875539 RepID=UPI001CC333C0|nr:NAD-dependent succinate-semialdehyde dehydrogenase [Arachidicoccus terrestris]UAY55560.1 NAD-dependent succinate-semialdehyde dehydrogenase [Arachidicoccus terrestris]
MSIQSINPATGQLIKEFSEESWFTVERKIVRAEKVWNEWKNTSFTARAALMKKASAVLLKQKDRLAELMAAEMGKPIKEGAGEVEKCAWVCRYYAENGARFLKDVLVETDAQKSYVSYQPIGTVLAIMPWNFPLWQVFRFIAPSILAGNCGLLKHASNVPGCAKAIELVMLDAGFPKGVFQHLAIGSKMVNQVIEHPFIKAVTLTGSTEAGQKVAAKAGSLIKKTVLELGGSDPYIILADANLKEAATICANSRLINNGQSCIAAKRFIVEKPVVKKFTSLLKEKMSQKIMGDPMDPATDLGPMARIDLRDQLHKQVLKNIEMGAKLILGGQLPKDAAHNAYYPATLLTNVKKGMPAYSEEIFGPVASVIIAKDSNDAIRIANDTTFGLGAAVFTKNKRKAEKMAREQLQAGACFVNGLVRSDPRLPFGGVKMSGYGRELGLHGIHEFVNIKTVYIAG